MIREGEPRLLLESALLGVVGALGAQLFTWMLHLCNHFFLYGLAGYIPPDIEKGCALYQTIGGHGLWIVFAVTTLGGLLSGMLIYRFAPEAEGHGTDAAVIAFHSKQGVIRTRVAPIKLVASAITIGSGGSAGREGPMALVAASLGSLYASLAHRSEQERRLLLLAGMAAGLAAIFRTPMGAGVFAIEVLYSNMEFEVGALLYTMLASAVAYTINGAFAGFGPLFSIPNIPVPMFSDDVGLIATILPQVFYRARFFSGVTCPRLDKASNRRFSRGFLGASAATDFGRRLWLDAVGYAGAAYTFHPSSPDIRKNDCFYLDCLLRRVRRRLRT